MCVCCHKWLYTPGTMSFLPSLPWLLLDTIFITKMTSLRFTYYSIILSYVIPVLARLGMHYYPEIVEEETVIKQSLVTTQGHTIDW